MGFETSVADIEAAITAAHTTTDAIADAIQAKTDNLPSKYPLMDFWSLPQEEVYVTNAAGDKSLPSVTVADLPAGATVIRAIAMFKFRSCEEVSSGVNKLSGAQEIQVKETAAGAYIDAINLVDDQFTLAADAREGGDVFIGAIDVTGEVDGNGTYDFQWDEALADADGIKFNDVQCGLRIWYSI